MKKTDPINTPKWLQIERIVRFSDTDAAGVMHFQQLLGWCHQAWEASLEQFGIPVVAVFPGGRAEQPSVALPIVHCHADFLAPIHVGDAAVIHLQPKRINPGCFEVISQIHVGDQPVANGGLQHLAIDAMTRQRCSLPEPIERWIEASTLGQIQPL
jgi:1,4-dihydroxy-2-naphthoyl-CoA hydrolase